MLFPLFSKPIYIESLDINTEEICNLLKDEKFQQTKSPHCLKSINQNILEKENIKFLKNKIFNSFDNYVKKNLKYKHDNFKITTSWLTKTTGDGSSELHRHRNSMFSGCLYLKTEPKKAIINFVNFDNNSFQLNIEENNIYNSQEFNFKMSEKLIMFFPSDLHHEILPNNQLKERISLAFNLIPTGLVGNELSDSHCKII